MRIAALVLAFPTCKALPPPPVVAGPADPSAPTRGTITATLVVGLAGASDGTGMGFAVRVEHQQTDRTTLGVELAGGAGDEARRDKEIVDPAQIHHRMIAVRGYGRFEVKDRLLALTYGVGLSYFDTGLVTGTLQGGLTLGWSNAYVTPVLPLGLAAALPLRTGRAFGLYDVPQIGGGLFEDHHTVVEPSPPSSRETRFPRFELYPYGGLGVIGKLGDTGNLMALDLELAWAYYADDSIATVSFSDAQQFSR